MPFCMKCGTSVSDTDQFCIRCGSSLKNTQPTSYVVVEPPKKRALNVAMLVFSIVVMLITNLPLGAIALVFTILATEETTDQGEKDKLKVAKILNVIGIVLMVITAIVTVVYLIFQTVIAMGSVMGGIDRFMDLIEMFAT